MCEHSRISICPNAIARCDECREIVEMEAVSYMKDGQIKHFLWQKPKPEDRSPTHPANRSDMLEGAPGCWYPREWAAQPVSSEGE
jgi:hypothetical protein